MFLTKADLAVFATKADVAAAIAVLEAHFQADISALETWLSRAMISQTYAILGGHSRKAAVAGLILAIARAFGH